jgi:hypothetical protein
VHLKQQVPANFLVHSKIDGNLNKLVADPSRNAGSGVIFNQALKAMLS